MNSTLRPKTENLLYIYIYIKYILSYLILDTFTAQHQFPAVATCEHLAQAGEVEESSFRHGEELPQEHQEGHGGEDHRQDHEDLHGLEPLCRGGTGAVRSGAVHQNIPYHSPPPYGDVIK